MPVINVSLLKGYDLPTRQALGTSLTMAVQQVIAAPPEAILVCINELDSGNYYRGGIARQGGQVQTDPATLVRDFLMAMQDRDLDKAKSFLGDAFVMTFPGGIQLTKLEDLVSWAKGRYIFVKKEFESFDTTWRSEHAVVYCHGTLHGQWLDGSEFAGIRFIDRFEVKRGKLVRQQVWNDMATVAGSQS
jgi:phenylpyruvate tautomerase PptA (4-oxalocrotonate tautomerase family)/limonene-1,2-epoxide hydrolase